VPPELLLGTDNSGKAAEYRVLLAGSPYRLVTPAEKGISGGVAETGTTFAANARLKAEYYAGASGLTALADDSGLEVVALDGAPGVLSARYAGEGASSAELVSYLLEKMAGVPPGRRAARFRCVIAIARPRGEVVCCEGQCSGVIAVAPRGQAGFGYDPVFYLPEMGKTMAELGMDEKNAISHRGRAAREALVLLRRMVLSDL